MKKRHSIQILLAVAAIFFAATACTHDELTDDTRLPEGQYPLQIAAVTLSVEGGEAQPWGAPQTRVSETGDGTDSKFDADDPFTVQIDGNTETATYIVQAGGKVTSNAPLYWSDRNTHTVTAWYSATDGTLDLSDQTNGLAYLLHGTGRGDYQTPVTLTFTYSLAKVRVMYSNDIANGEVTSLKLYTYTQCTHNQGNDVQGATPGWIEMKKCEYNGVTCWEANVVPDYEITKLMANNDGKERPLSTTIKPVAGKFYNITLNNDKGYTIDSDGNYNVYSEAGLKAWAEALQDNNSLNIILTADITLTPPAEGESNWSPKWGYDGIFDGNGKTITGLTIEYGEATYAGLFAQLGENGTVKNLTLKDVNITAAYYTGAVAGRNNGTIENCSVSGTVESSSDIAGGITGYNNGTITGCTASGDVSAGFATGGIVGNFVKGKITDCHSYATVEGGNSVGGVVGYMDSNATLAACSSTYSVTAEGSGDASVGGVVGYINTGATVTACYATGSVTATQGYNVGGVVGSSLGGIITACYHATGKVSGSARVGGVLGLNQTGSVASVTVTACYWNGTVTDDKGIGNDMTNAGETTKVEGTTVTWTNAIGVMNTALSGTDWHYVLDTDGLPVLEKNQ